MMIAEATKWEIRLLSCNIVFKITVVGEISDFYPVKPLYACNVSCVFWLLLKVQAKLFSKKFFASGAKRSAESIHRPWVNSTVSNQTDLINALQLLISAIARFCDIKTIRSLWGSNPHRFATCRGQPLNERGYLGEPSKRCGFVYSFRIQAS